MLKGEKTKILGTIGDFEIGAKWKWKIPIHTIGVVLLAIAVAFLIFVAASFFYLQVKFVELVEARSEIQAIKSEILEIRSLMQKELEEIRRFKEELIDLSFSNLSPERNVSKFRRSTDSQKPSGKSKTNKSFKMKHNLTSNKSSTDNLKQPSPSLVSGVHLERDISYYHTGTDGIFIGWQPQFSSPVSETVQLDSKNSSLVIQTTGLYFIYAQVCYTSTKGSNGFEVRLMNRAATTTAESKNIALCSAGTSKLGGDVTCSSSVTKVLHKGDRLFLQQLQKDRGVLMSHGRSFWGIVKLAAIDLPE